MATTGSKQVSYPFFRYQDARADERASGGGRVAWPRKSHERRVEAFYSIGATRFGDCHGGYLNFGLWEDGCDYLRAAENMVRHLASWGGVDDRSRLLDVGCGFGAQDVYLARNFRPRAIVGVDIAWPHVLAARARAREAGLGLEVRFEHGNATDLSVFPAGSFTHALGLESIVHFDTRERFFREAARVLAPGGTLLLADYALRRPPRGLLDRLFVSLVRRCWQVPVGNVGTVESYRCKVDAAGFCEVEIESVGDRTIPGYFREQCSRGHRRALRAIRGRSALWLGLAMDFLVHNSWARGQLDYILVRARKR